MVRFALSHGIKPTTGPLVSAEKPSENGSDATRKTPWEVLWTEAKPLIIRTAPFIQNKGSGSSSSKRDFPPGAPVASKSTSDCLCLRKLSERFGTLKRKRKKHKTKHDLRAIKARWRAFEQIDIDTKDLEDIPELWPQIRRLNLPKIQYTARDVVSGLQVLAYAQERSLSCATLFAHRIIYHLRSCRVQLKDCRFQTDNGSEFLGAWNAKGPSSFTLAVESAHRLIEVELYEVETFCNRQDFLHKATAFPLWFNVARPNTYKSHKTPWQIIHERDPTISPRAVILPPVFVDELYKKSLGNQSKGGDHVYSESHYSLKT